MSIWTPDQVRKQLGEKGKALKLRIPQMQTLLSQERFLTRFAQLEQSRFYVWKGGSLVLRLYSGIETPRYTVDVDLLARGIDVAETENLFRQAMDIHLDDGYLFTNLVRSEIKRDTPYGGDRFKITWSFFHREQSEELKIDVCAGDDVDPRVVQTKDVFLLPDEENLSLAVYPPEFVFAEKLETADRFFTGNTRLKDFIDLWRLTQLPMNQNLLASAIQRCFERRNREFKIGRFQKLFTDAEFVSLMEQARERKFKNLSLPPVSSMFEELSEFVERLSI